MAETPDAGAEHTRPRRRRSPWTDPTLRRIALVHSGHPRSPGPGASRRRERRAIWSCTASIRRSVPTRTRRCSRTPRDGFLYGTTSAGGANGDGHHFQDGRRRRQLRRPARLQRDRRVAAGMPGLILASNGSSLRNDVRRRHVCQGHDLQDRHGGRQLLDDPPSRRRRRRRGAAGPARAGHRHQPLRRRPLRRREQLRHPLSDRPERNGVRRPPRLRRHPPKARDPEPASSRAATPGSTARPSSPPRAPATARSSAPISTAAI